MLREWLAVIRFKAGWFKISDVWCALYLYWGAKEVGCKLPSTFVPLDPETGRCMNWCN